MNPQQAREKLARLEANIEKVIRGKTEVVRLSIIGLLAGGHVLFEDVPGVGKTTLAQCLSKSLGLSFQRIQFTSDLLPSDILGVMIYDQNRREFEFRQGPIFANIVLVDEINRTTPKTQSALLEAMNTAQISIERNTYDLPRPFLVMATQNPVESHGTFPLPQSQLDRFLLRLHVGYPSAEHEKAILSDPRAANDLTRIETVLTAEDIAAMQAGAADVKIEPVLIDYIVRLAQATRQAPGIEVGVSTRGALALRRCAQARAYLEGRAYCTPDDIKSLAVPVLAHRIVLVRAMQGATDTIGQGSGVIRALLDEVEVPV